MSHSPASNPPTTIALSGDQGAVAPRGRSVVEIMVCRGQIEGLEAGRRVNIAARYANSQTGLPGNDHLTHARV